MRLFDSHCHLDDSAFAHDRESVIQRAREGGVAAFMTVGITVESSAEAVAIAGAHPGCYASVGIHPHDAASGSDAGLTSLRRLTRNPRVRAWGEVGLDFNRMHSPRPDQEYWLFRQLDAADELGLPLIFHERDSGGRLLEILTDRYPSGRAGVVHCFSGTEGELEAYLALGLHIGITGILTIPGRGETLRAMVPGIPRDRLLVETDAPYLTPKPERNRHRRNEPAFVRSTLLKLAEVREESPEELAAAVWKTTCRLFGIPA